MGKRKMSDGTPIRRFLAAGVSGERGFWERERERDEGERNLELVGLEVIARPVKAKLDGGVIKGRDLEMGIGEGVVGSSRKNNFKAAQTAP
jgi:hypothetical protein